MVPMFFTPLGLIVIVVAFVIIAMAATSRRKRLNDQHYRVRVCPQCGASGPPHAGFCRNCGTRLLD